MKGLTVAVFVACGLVAMSNAIEAGDSPATFPATPFSPSPSPSAASPAPSETLAPLPRFGYVAQTAQFAVYQPGLDRFTANLKDRLGDALALDLVPMPADSLTLLNAATCKRLRLSGFALPHRNWRIDETTVTVEAELSLLDCQGNMFYHGFDAQTVQRDNTLMPQTQIGDTQLKAMNELVHKVGTFKAVHESAWNVLLRTGTLDGSTPVIPTAATPNPRDA